MTTTDSLPTDEAEAFRERCREFLREHATGVDLGGRPDPRGERRLEIARRFQGALTDAGLAGLTYPKEYGGAGLTKAHERIWRDEYAKFPLMTSELTISHGMCLPMLAEFGTHEQKEAWLARCISATDVWCQMFSEPGAGSDVAGLQMTAVRDGDEWVLDGQKVWTTLAHVSRYGIVIARTDPDVAKHAGISMFVVPLDAPGVEVRPIHQMDGSKHFNEVFFTEVRIPTGNLLGELDNGWNMATAMLMYERVAIGTGATSGVDPVLSSRLIREARSRGRLDEPALRQQLMRLYAMETTLALVGMRTRAETRAGRTPGPGGSISKLLRANMFDLHRKLTFEIVGPDSVAWSDPADAEWQRTALSSFQSRIAGGTNEIQRNIIGDRVLGLPRDIAVDRGVPFRELLKN